MATPEIRTDGETEPLPLVEWERDSTAMYSGKAVKVLQPHAMQVGYYLVRFLSTNQLRYVHGARLYEVSEP